MPIFMAEASPTAHRGSKTSSPPGENPTVTWGAIDATHGQIARVINTLAVRCARLMCAAALVSIAACTDSSRALDWRDESAEIVSLAASADAAQRERALMDALTLMPEAAQPLAPSAPLPVIETPPAPNLALGDGAAPIDSLRCDGSLEVRMTSRGEVAVWWSLRARGAVHLFAAWRDANQTTWRGPIVVDTLDVGSTDARDAAQGGAVACTRPAPGLAVDGANGYVHVAYALVGPEGPGIFYAHQMDPRAAFEPPIPIVYGERLGTVRVGSDGDLVAVVYEDPNSGARQRISLAVSRTAGHIFERRINVNAGLNPAANPFVVAGGSALVIGWQEVPPTGGDTTFLRRRAVVR